FVHKRTAGSHPERSARNGGRAKDPLPEHAREAEAWPEPSEGFLSPPHPVRSWACTAPGRPALNAGKGSARWPTPPISSALSLRSETAGSRRESPLLLRGRRRGRLNQLEIELSFAFDKEHTLRGRIAARRVPVVAARLQELRSGAEPEFRLALRSLDESPGHDHDLHIVRVGVEGRSESGRELEERPECALRVIAPHIRNLDSGGPGRVHT